MITHKIKFSEEITFPDFYQIPIDDLIKFLVEHRSDSYTHVHIHPKIDIEVGIEDVFISCTKLTKDESN